MGRTLSRRAPRLIPLSDLISICYPSTNKISHSNFQSQDNGPGRVLHFWAAFLTAGSIGKEA